MLEKSNVRTEALYNDERTHRYSLKKVWDNNKPSAAIIMIAPSEKANEVCCDMTTMYTLNNVYLQGFGSVDILNLYSKLDAPKPESDRDNDEWIAKICQKADRIILAWGKGQNTVEVAVRILSVLRLLQPYKDKLFEIADANGKCGYHPLGASVRLGWQLVPFDYSPYEKTA